MHFGGSGLSDHPDELPGCRTPDDRIIDQHDSIALQVLGDRMAAVCVEMTKKFETIDRDYLSELVGRYAGIKVKGEITVVIAGNHRKFRRAEASS